MAHKVGSGSIVHVLDGVNATLGLLGIVVIRAWWREYRRYRAHGRALIENAMPELRMLGDLVAQPLRSDAVRTLGQWGLDGDDLD